MNWLNKSSKSGVVFHKLKKGELMSMCDITMSSMHMARNRIGPMVRRTALISSPLLTEHVVYSLVRARPLAEQITEEC
jgi:hypothetical protein